MIRGRWLVEVNECNGDFSPIDEIAYQLSPQINFRFADHLRTGGSF